METVIIETEGKKLKALLSVLDIPFRKEKSSYNRKFVAKIRQAKCDVADGRITKVKTESELKELLNSL
ncbi:DUF2683 family protein [Dyadobacter sp. 32]|uniref:DUF2683 family protein n=1 Tax=Dyadobacter sp. 32 TaxID=538966 RepID=UPI0011ED6D47